MFHGLRHIIGSRNGGREKDLASWSREGDAAMSGSGRAIFVGTGTGDGTTAIALCGAGVKTGVYERHEEPGRLLTGGEIRVLAQRSAGRAPDRAHARGARHRPVLQPAVRGHAVPERPAGRARNLVGRGRPRAAAPLVSVRAAQRVHPHSVVSFAFRPGCRAAGNYSASARRGRAGCGRCFPGQVSPQRSAVPTLPGHKGGRRCARS